MGSLIKCSNCGYIYKDLDEAIKGEHKCNGLREFFYHRFITFPMLIILLMGYSSISNLKLNWLIELAITAGLCIVAFIVQGVIDYILKKL